MRKQLQLLATGLFAFSWASSQVVYDNFENQRRVKYDFVHGVLDPYTTNPGAGGPNSSPVCGKYIRNAAEQFDVLVLIPGGLMDDVSAYVSGTKTMSIDVYSPAAGIPIQITLESAIEFIEEDELVEVTPKTIRLRKRFLLEHERKRASRESVAA